MGLGTKNGGPCEIAVTTNAVKVLYCLLVSKDSKVQKLQDPLFLIPVLEEGSLLLPHQLHVQNPVLSYRSIVSAKSGTLISQASKRCDSLTVNIRFEFAKNRTRRMD